MTNFGPALDLANAVLYEGYLLYPYTASAAKNRIRWQFGVVVPAAYASDENGESAEQQTEVLVEPDGVAAVDVLIRFLQVEARRVEALSGSSFEPVEMLEVGGTKHVTFDEAVEREVYARVQAAPGLQTIIPIAFEESRSERLLSDADGRVAGRIVRERWPLRGTVEVTADPAAENADLIKLRVRTENHSDVVDGPRSEALRTSFVSTHTLLAVDHGSFLSALDPPHSVNAATATLANRKTWPVLVGAASEGGHAAALVLSSPIILYDFARVAPQTDANAFDATEIDELLTLSVLSLSDAEREEARVTDPRARALVERAERFGPAAFARLHAGALRQDDPLDAVDVPSVDCVFVGGTKVTKGSVVRLRPSRRADVWDSFLAGKTATVRAIHQDLEDIFYVCVTVDDDPASDLHEWYGRSFFFYPDEIEPLVEAG